MFRLAWLTDIHLNFLKPAPLRSFLASLRKCRADAFLVTGDIAESTDVCEYLEQLDDVLERPLYFVLGNHDFYFGSIRETRRRVCELCRERPRLTYLTHESFVPLSDDLALVGHDGWADARVGDYARSPVMLNDYQLIEELAGFDKMARLEVLRRLGDEAGEHVRREVPAALQRHATVVFATHVPPLREACWHEGRISDDEWSPHFTCLAAGQALTDVMRRHPARRLVGLCGHTHGSGATRPLENLEIHTGGAEYGFPAINRVWEL